MHFKTKIEKSIKFTSLLLIAVGCSGLQSNKSESLKTPDLKSKAEVKRNIVQQSWESVDYGLSKVVEEARTQGPPAVKFLSGDLFIKGSDASVRGDSKAASIIFKHVYALNPKDTYIGKRYAVELIRSGQMDEAKKLLVRLQKERHFDETLSLILAGVYTATNDAELAQKTYKEILTKDKGNEEACVFLAKSYAIDKAYKKAMSLLSKCQKHERKAIFSYYKGKIAVTEKKFERAAKYFREALKVDPDYYQAVNALGIYYEEKGDSKRAQKLYTEFLKRNKNSYSVLSRMVNLLFEEGKIREVIPYAERLSNLDSNDLNLKVRLGILYTDARRYDDAKGVFKEILASVPDSDKILYYLGSLYQQTKEFEKSLEYFNRIPETSSLYMDSSLQIAQILNVFAHRDMEKGETAEIDRFKSFVEKKAGAHAELKVEMKVILAGFYENNHQLAEAISAVESVKTEKDFNEGHDYYLAALYEKNNEFLKARTIIKRMLELNPNNANALNFLGYSMLERGDDLKKAFEYIAKAVQLKPDDGYIRDSLGWYYYKTGNIKKAYREIKKAWKLVDKSDSVISKHLAMIYKEMKKYDQAKKYYVEALRNCKLDSEKADVIKELEALENLRLPASIED
ncbi:tetratricopeptide repeat protein [Halobacteriovorax sp. GB3]|uniref:tetratricopeptide repeat protein n=1 Tax=Halobacteriovorax sp. GB3 TaxID=2719615 RepID=UPI00236021C1|nr:tetratricopeptide repeat protein [Halobacteriovorax sp. GB3]MDD0854188.1 tetratricopeptide repeat protein [Halobacteriovorax sp. GB3]